MKYRGIAAFAVVGLLLAGCGGGSVAVRLGSSAGRPRRTAGTHSANHILVVMKNINFNPTRVTAKVGDTITWTNRDVDTSHNVTYVSGPKFVSSPTFPDGHSWSLKLTKPGVINYLCTIHPGMDGSIVVKP
jgi:plastocyanin